MSEKKTKARKPKPARLTVEPGDMEKSESPRAHVLKVEPGSFELTGLVIDLSGAIEGASSVTGSLTVTAPETNPKTRKRRGETGGTNKIPKNLLSNTYPKKEHLQAAARFGIADVSEGVPSFQETRTLEALFQIYQETTPEQLAQYEEVFPEEKISGETLKREIKFQTETGEAKWQETEKTVIYFTIPQLTRLRIGGAEGFRPGGSDRKETLKILDSLSKKSRLISLPYKNKRDGRLYRFTEISPLIERFQIAAPEEAGQGDSVICRLIMSGLITYKATTNFVPVPLGYREAIAKHYPGGKTPETLKNLTSYITERGFPVKDDEVLEKNEKDLLEEVAPHLLRQRKKGIALKELEDSFKAMEKAGRLKMAKRTDRKDGKGKKWQWIVNKEWKG